MSPSALCERIGISLAPIGELLTASQYDSKTPQTRFVTPCVTLASRHYTRLVPDAAPACKRRIAGTSIHANGYVAVSVYVRCICAQLTQPYHIATAVIFSRLALRSEDMRNAGEGGQGITVRCVTLAAQPFMVTFFSTSVTAEG